MADSFPPSLAGIDPGDSRIQDIMEQVELIATAAFGLEAIVERDVAIQPVREQ